MAKLSQVLRDRRRKQLIAKHKDRRAELRAKLRDPNVSMEEKFQVQKAFAKLPRNSCPTRLKRRCGVSGRARSNYRKFGISRIAMRDLTHKGSFPACASRAGEGASMKPEIHPDYHKVLFVDSATGKQWVTRSTLTSKDTKLVDGEEIPVVKLEIFLQPSLLDRQAPRARFRREDRPLPPPLRQQEVEPLAGARAGPVVPEDPAMARRCELTGTGPQSGHNVRIPTGGPSGLLAESPAGLAVQRRAAPSVGMRITTRALRTVQRHGGIDAYLLATADERLAPEGLRLKRRIEKILAG